MSKSGTLLLSALLLAGAAVISLGSGLRAIDYLADAGASKAVQATGQFLLNPIAGAVILLLGIVFAVKAFNMSKDSDQGSVTTRSAPPKITVLSTHVLPIDRSFQPTGPQTGAHGAIVRFKNEADPKRDVGSMIGTRATISVAAGSATAHAKGLWTDEKTAIVDFHPGDIHDLLIAVQVAGETSVPDVLPDDVRMWNISGSPYVKVTVQLVAGIERPIVRNFDFKLQLEPDFRIAQG